MQSKWNSQNALQIMIVFLKIWDSLKEVVRNGDVRIIKSNSRYITISYGDKSKEIEKSRLEKYKVMVQTKCVVLKIKALWNSSENNLYGIEKRKL